jgi:hypothetical protein
MSPSRDSGTRTVRLMGFEGTCVELRLMPGSKGFCVMRCISRVVVWLHLVVEIAREASSSPRPRSQVPSVFSNADIIFFTKKEWVHAHFMNSHESSNSNSDDLPNNIPLSLIGTSTFTTCIHGLDVSSSLSFSVSSLSSPFLLRYSLSGPGMDLFCPSSFYIW